MTKKTVKEHVESLYVDDYAITEANEIDIEAISFDQGATVIERELKGCEAMIIGANDKATITINSKSNEARKRFSIGHELGHWFKDRGKVGNLCSKHDMDSPNGKSKMRENIANSFASELLIPNYLLIPKLTSSKLNLELIRAISNDFNTSFIASLRRVISTNFHMGFFAIYKKNGSRRLFHANSDMPYSFLPPQQAPQGSLVYKRINGLSNESTEVIDGCIWCKDQWGDQSEVREQAFHYHDNEYITVVYWEQEEPIWQCIEHKEN
jgi:Zn-dependent peptidase ImmA (M78 family)